jgi:hypothetical protein
MVLLSPSQADEDGDDGDHHQQFDQRGRLAAPGLAKELEHPLVLQKE